MDLLKLRAVEVQLTIGWRGGWRDTSNDLQVAFSPNEAERSMGPGNKRECGEVAEEHVFEGPIKSAKMHLFVWYGGCLTYKYECME